MYILFILLGAMLLYVLQFQIFKHHWEKGLSLELHFSSNHAMEDEELNLTETIINQKLLPLPILRVKFTLSRNLIFSDSPNSNVSDNFYRDDLLSILMYQKLTRTLSFRCSHRGYYRLDQADLVINDIFMSVFLAKHIPLSEELFVYPKLLEDQEIELPFKTMLGTILTRRYYNEDPFEFASIREYQTYDNMKDINWKASAKTGDLKVNVHDYTASQQVSILLNLEKQTLLHRDTLMEESIRLAATYANAFINSGIPVALYTNGVDLRSKEPIILTAGSGTSHMDTINEGLSRIDLHETASSFLTLIHPILKKTTSQDYFLIISTYQKEDLQNRLLDLKQVHQDFSWVVPLDTQIQNEVCKDLEGNCFTYLMSEAS